MEYLLATVIVSVALLIIVVPAVWSSDPARRADAREVLRMILTAFGRRKI